MTYFHNFYDYIYLYIHSKTSLNNFISNFHFGLTQLFLEHWLMGVIIHLPADLGCQARNHEGKSCLDIAGEKTRPSNAGSDGDMVMVGKKMRFILGGKIQM